MDLEQLNKTLQHEIPLTEALAVTLSDYRNNSLTVNAPLAPNINHKQTAFGGSLYSVAVLAGWALVNLRLSEHDTLLQQRAQVVIYHSEMQYMKAVHGDFSAKVTQSAALQNPRFIQRLLRFGKNSCLESIEILEQNEVKARLNAKYVVVLPD